MRVSCLFYLSAKKFDESSIEQDDFTATENNRVWIIEFSFYILFPIVLIYLNKYQIYGMDRIEIWFTLSHMVALLFIDGEFIGGGMDIDFNFIIQELRSMSI